MYKKRICTFVLLLCALCLGCSKNVGVSGRVTFKEDGSPLSSGMIIFSDAKNEARANLQQDGSYVLGYEKKGNGIPRGEYTVYIVGAVEITKNNAPSKERTSNPMRGELPEGFQGMDGRENQKVKQLIAKQYRSANTSTLKANITGKIKNLDFQIERP